MTRTLASVFVALAMTVALPGVAQENSLLVDWADHARDPKALAGDPVFLRRLSCADPYKTNACELMVVTVSQDICPLRVEAWAYRSQDRNLRVMRSGDKLDIEVLLPLFTDRLRIGLIKSDLKYYIVGEASGVRVSKPIGDEGVRATELVAYVNTGSSGVPYAHVDLNCSMLSVVAAKKASK